jgi:hypothetical protein
VRTAIAQICMKGPQIIKSLPRLWEAARSEEKFPLRFIVTIPLLL